MVHSVATLLVLSPLCIAAQQSLTNDEIVKLVKAGLSEDLIISTINSKPSQFHTTIDDLIALKTAGVSDKEVAAMESKASDTDVRASESASPNSSAPSNSDSPDSPHEAGIYASSNGVDGKANFEMLEPTVYTQGKVGGIVTSGLTYGIVKAKTKAVLRGGHANARVTDPHSVFYFYFEEPGAGLSHASSPFGGTSTPNEYTLLKFQVKGATRETVIGKFNAYGASGGTDEKSTIPFKYVKLKPGIYKVTLDSPLQPGEYGFVVGTGTVAAGPYVAALTSPGKVFDFGVN